MPRAEEGVLLQLKFDKGPPYYAEFGYNAKAIAKIGGKHQPLDLMVSLTFQCTPKGINQAGSGLVELKLIAAKIKYDFGGQPVEYESSNPNPKSIDGISWFHHSLIGVELQIEVTRNGEI